MTPTEKGVYRDLLDELWLRDGLLPLDERVLRSVSRSSPKVWAKVRANVLSHFTLTKDGWRNATHDKIQSESQYRAEKQKRYRNKHSNVTNRVTSNVTQSPSPSPSLVQKEQSAARTSSEKNEEETPMSTPAAAVKMIVRVLQDLLATSEPFESYADLRDELKWRCAKLHIAYDGGLISAALNQVERGGRAPVVKQS